MDALKRYCAIVSWSCLLLVTLTSATLRVKFTLPTQDDADTTCVTHYLIPVGSTNPGLRGVWKWWPAGGDSINAPADSMSGVPGAQVLRDITVPTTGVYRIKAWAVDAGGKSCDTTVTKNSLKYRPYRITWTP